MSYFCQTITYRISQDIGADIQSKVQELEDLNSSLRERDKVKDDAIAHLSDQLLAISTRLQELERKQQTVIGI
jgi:thiamine phosphate synthase YjbQ (UPF0047 family)